MAELLPEGVIKEYIRDIDKAGMAFTGTILWNHINALTAKLADAERERDEARPVVEAAVKWCQGESASIYDIAEQVGNLEAAVSAYLATSAAGDGKAGG